MVLSTHTFRPKMTWLPRRSATSWRGSVTTSAPWPNSPAASKRSCGCTCRRITGTTPTKAAAKQSYTEGLLSVIDAIAAAVAPRDPSSARADVLDAFAMMVGAVQLSRAVNDSALAQEILDSVTVKVLRMLGVAAA
jgi:hypothetical protein